MKEKDFSISRENSKKFLNKFDFLKSADFYRKPISQKFINICRENDFLKLYKFAIDNADYHFLLFDNSFIQLEYNKESKNKTTLRYAFYESPYDFPDYKKYLLVRNLRFRDVGHKYIGEYEQELSESSIKQPFVIIRYDYSEKEYRCGGHSISHFHFGYGNSESIRITSSILVSPILFILYIIKQVYYDKWVKLLDKDGFMEYYKKAKSKCKNIDDNFFKTLDKKELYLV